MARRKPASEAVRIALLRGLNVGAKNRLSMKALVSILESLGASRVATAGQSGNAERDPKSLHVFFLESPPPAPDLGALERMRKGTERWVLDGALFYLHTPDGFARSGLAAGAERALGVAATARNWRSLAEIASLVERFTAMG